MPGGDRTGPTGLGPQSGRGAGFCVGASAPGWLSRGCGAGFFGQGRGGRGRRGRRNLFYATGLTAAQRAASEAAAMGRQAPPASEEQELQMLKQQAEAAAATLEQVRRRIDELCAVERQVPEQE